MLHLQEKEPGAELCLSLQQGWFTWGAETRPRSVLARLPLLPVVPGGLRTLRKLRASSSHNVARRPTVGSTIPGTPALRPSVPVTKALLAKTSNAHVLATGANNVTSPAGGAVCPADPHGSAPGWLVQAIGFSLKPQARSGPPVNYCIAPMTPAAARKPEAGPPIVSFSNLGSQPPDGLAKA